jgi:hypothetical protein
MARAQLLQDGARILRADGVGAEDLDDLKQLVGLKSNRDSLCGKLGR